jgi:hypothetical protein
VRFFLLVLFGFVLFCYLLMKIPYHMPGVVFICFSKDTKSSGTTSMLDSTMCMH